MESKDRLKEIDIKNRTLYYFDDIMRALDIDTDIKRKSENISIYDISYKTSTGGKPLRSRYDKIDGFIKIHNKIRYIVLFDDWCEKICDRIKYLVSNKRGITNSINYNFARIRIT